MLVITIETGIEAASAISKSFHLYYVPFTRFFFSRLQRTDGAAKTSQQIF
jgi:hypothetical protein